MNGTLGEHTSSIEMLMSRVMIVFDFTDPDEAEKFYDFVVSTALDRGTVVLDFRNSRVARVKDSEVTPRFTKAQLPRGKS